MMEKLTIAIVMYLIMRLLQKILNRFLNVKDVDDSVLKDLISLCKKNIPDKSSAVITESQTTSGGKNGKHKLVL